MKSRVPVTVQVPDRVPKDVPTEYQELYLEGLRAGRLQMSRSRFLVEVYTLRRKVEHTKNKRGLIPFLAQRELNEVQLMRDIWLQGYRTGDEERRYCLKGGL